MASDIHDPLVGAVLADRYGLRGVAGEETLGRVFEAVDLRTGATVGVKVLDPRLSREDAALHRFRKEIEALVALAHPHVPRVLDVGRHRDLFEFFVVERIVGERLGTLVHLAAPMDLRRIAGIGAQIARVLAACHARAILHRNVSAGAAIALDNAEWGDFVVLSDFGDALVGLDDEVERPGPSGFVGTLGFAAPEYLDRGTATEAGDVYGLGVLLYALRCGRLPFEGPDGVVVDGHVHRPPPAPHGRIGVPETWLDRLILAMLEKDPEARPTAVQVDEALQRGTGTPLDAPPLAPPGVVVARDRHTGRSGPRRREADGGGVDRWVDLGALAVIVFLVASVALIAVQLARLSLR